MTHKDSPIRTLADVSQFAEAMQLKPEGSMQPRWSKNGCDLSINHSSMNPRIEIRAEQNPTTGHDSWTAQFTVGTPTSVIAAAVNLASTVRPVDEGGDEA